MVQKTSALRPASQQPSCLFFFILSRSLPSPRCFLFCLVASLRAPCCCACLAEVNVDSEMRRLIRFLYLKLFFDKSWHHAALAPLGQQPLSAAHLFCRLPFPATCQFVTFLLVSMSPQQLESSICPHIGTTSSGGISKVSSHASSVELNFALSKFAAGRGDEIACNDVRSFLSVTYLSWPKSLALQCHAPSPSCCSSAQRQMCMCTRHVWTDSKNRLTCLGSLLRSSHQARMYFCGTG